MGAPCISAGNGGTGCDGGSIRGIYLYGGHVTFEGTYAPCISAGNGGIGGKGVNKIKEIQSLRNAENEIENLWCHGGTGGNGGNVNVCIYGGQHLLKSTTACIKSGNGGSGGAGGDEYFCQTDLFGRTESAGAGNGGDGGNAGKLVVCFSGGNTQIESGTEGCIRCGEGGSAGAPGYSSVRTLQSGKAGSSKSPSVGVSGSCVMNGNIHSSSLSVQYKGIYGIGSVLSQGNLTIICTIAAAFVFGLGGFVAGKTYAKKKTLVTLNGTSIEDENDE